MKLSYAIWFIYWKQSKIVLIGIKTNCCSTHCRRCRCMTCIFCRVCCFSLVTTHLNHLIITFERTTSIMTHHICTTTAFFGMLFNYMLAVTLATHYTSMTWLSSTSISLIKRLLILITLMHNSIWLLINPYATWTLQTVP